MIFPSLAGNFLQIPDSFISALVSQSLTRNEMVVCLHLARGTFALHNREPLASIESIALAIELPADAVEGAVARAVDRGVLLRFEVVGSEDVKYLYGLHTVENHVLAGYEADHPTTAPIAIPPPSQEQPPIDRGENTVTSPMKPTVLNRILGIIGRDLTKDEKDRLEALGASDDDINEAIDRIQSRKIQVYSSDQIIYEYESIQLQKRQQVSEARKTGPNRIKAICAKCGGTGYLFVGKSSLRVCECKGKR